MNNSTRVPTLCMCSVSYSFSGSTSSATGGTSSVRSHTAWEQGHSMHHTMFTTVNRDTNADPRDTCRLTAHQLIDHTSKVHRLLPWGIPPVGRKLQILSTVPNAKRRPKKHVMNNCPHEHVRHSPTSGWSSPKARGLHSSTFRLNVSAFCGTGGAFRGCLRSVWEVLGGIRGCLQCILCQTRLRLS